ncbi:MAG: SHOCT domain-containing protein, partial [Solirubrobacterales bacterium]
ATAATPFATAPDSLSRLERLDRLRRQGSLTEAEFQTLKAKIVEDG